MENRDPRLDPSQGDLLRGLGDDGKPRYIRIHWTTDAEVGYLKAEDFGLYGSLLRIDLDKFRILAAGAEVVQVGSND